MPILIYFGVTAPILLALLLAVSAHLEPSQATDLFQLVGITSAQANVSPPASPLSRPDSELFSRLQSRPLK